MKIQNVFLSAVIALSGPAALACGQTRSAGQQDARQELLKRISGKKLTCFLKNGAESAGVVNIYALFRCIGSPVGGNLTAFDTTKRIETIHENADRSIVMGLKSSSRQVTCHIQK